MNSFQKISRNKFVKNVKAISPIFATLILIAIAVIAGVVVYLFVSGTLGNFTGQNVAGTEKVAVQSASVDTNGLLTVYYQATSGPLPTITGIQVRDSGGNVIQTLTPAGTVTPTSLGSLVYVTATPSPALTTGATYSINLITKAGGNFPSSSFTAP